MNGDNSSDNKDDKYRYTQWTRRNDSTYIECCKSKNVSIETITLLVKHCDKFVGILQRDGSNVKQRGSYWYRQRFVTLSSKGKEIGVSWNKSQQEFHQWLVQQENERFVFGGAVSC